MTTSWSPIVIAEASSCWSVGEGERGPRASGRGAGASSGDTGTVGNGGGGVANWKVGAVDESCCCCWV